MGWTTKCSGGETSREGTEHRRPGVKREKENKEKEWKKETKIKREARKKRRVMDGTRDKGGVRVGGKQTTAPTGH